MSLNLDVYVEERRDDRWEFVGEIEGNDAYDPAASTDEPRFAPVSRYTGSSFLLRAALGYADSRLLAAVAPAFPLHCQPADLSLMLRTWVVGFHLPGDAVQVVALRDLAACDWKRTCTIVTWWDEQKLLPGMEVIADTPRARVVRERIWRATGKVSSVRTVRWQMTYAVAVGPAFLREVVEPLVATYGASDDARIVYWFY